MPNKLTNEAFKAKAQLKHAGRYDYSRCQYTLAHVPVEIICDAHGSFFQKPGQHLYGRGCPYCAGTLKHTNETFIKRAQQIHGLSTYSYANVDYVNNRTKVEIGCPQHGSFWMMPNSHLDGKQGCPKCRGNRPTEVILNEFFIRSKERHGDRFDYSHVQLRTVNDKVTILCPTHGPFRQLIYKHMDGHGCPECSVNRRLTTKTFLDAARQIHGTRYGYEEVQYIRSSQKVTIHCPDHGNYLATPNHHLRGVGCPVCAGKAITTKDFIDRATEIHGHSRYDYSKSIYVDSKSKIEVICPKHGSFWPTPTRFITNKTGCRRCASVKSGGYRRSEWVARQNGRKAVLYFIECTSDTERFHKLGITLTGISRRFNSAKDFNYHYKVLHICESLDAAYIWDLEKVLLSQFKEYRYTPLTRFGGDGECFVFPDLQAIIKSIE